MLKTGDISSHRQAVSLHVQWSTWQSSGALSQERKDHQETASCKTGWKRTRTLWRDFRWPVQAESGNANECSHFFYLSYSRRIEGRAGGKCDWLSAFSTKIEDSCTYVALHVRVHVLYVLESLFIKSDTHCTWLVRVRSRVHILK